MTLTVGAKMVRLEDGMEGVVEVDYSREVLGLSNAVAVFYCDRGEKMRAKKSEQWVPEMTPSRILTPAERMEVARTADAFLQSLDRNSPYCWWDRASGPPHDPALVELIVEYLKKRA